MEAKEWAQAEMAGAKVWDPRCRRSLATMCEKLVDQPGKSFSAACGPATRQAAHRIFEHPSSDPAGLLAGHFAHTAARCAAHPLVLVAQDTTEYNYSSHKAMKDLGPLGRGQMRGLLGHGALALTVEGEPLGLLHLALWAREEAPALPPSGEATPPSPEKKGKKKEAKQARPSEEKESQKWIEGLRGVETALPPEQAVLIIADREADVFAYLAAPRRANTHLLIRAYQMRLVLVAAGSPSGKPARGYLPEVARTAPVVGQMRVRIPRQPGRPEEREATLEVRAIAVSLQPPQEVPEGVPRTPLAVYLIFAREIDPPVGEQRIRWLLLATMPVNNGEEACQMVRYYALRWRIERWHFTLKSGCKVEELQIDDSASTMNALAVYGVVAWRLLWLTYVARTQPEKPVAEVLSEEEWIVLEQGTRRPVRTAREAVRAIAKLGGFAGTPSEGEPGVKALWLGLRELQAMVKGWRLAHAPPVSMLAYSTIHG